MLLGAQPREIHQDGHISILSVAICVQFVLADDTPWGRYISGHVVSIFLRLWAQILGGWGFGADVTMG